MALEKQIHIYSIDTNAFYNDSEKKLYKNVLEYRSHKKRLTNIDKNKLNEKQLKVYNKMYKNINKRLQEHKENLKNQLKMNTEVRILDKNYLIDLNIISIFESALTRTIKLKIDKLTTDIMVIQTYHYDIIEQLIKNGFLYNKEKYIYLTSSAGQIRTKKTVFIKESIWNKYEKTLMCGLTVPKINELGGINANKFLAYLALSNSATDQWNNFDIDRCIVVKDFETHVESEVDFINDSTYEIERKKLPIPITHTDGCGMILPKLSKKNFMIRLPWVKGLLASFDFIKFIKENNCSHKIKDIYGTEWDIIKDDIQIIFTESQFKMSKYYKNWRRYKKQFKKFNCQAGICNIEEDYFSNATINYQMLQTLTDITDKEIENLLKPSNETLNKLVSDKKTILRVFGVTKSNENKTYLQQALEIYPELLQDEYCKNVLRQIKKSLVNSYRAGKLDINGKYTFLIPDLYAFCEWLFLGIKNPIGLLENKQVYCKLFDDSQKLDCLRSPHLYREHAVRINIIDDKKRKWFKTKAIYTSSHDIISKILQFDNDGDKALVVADKNFVDIAERNIKNDNILPLYYDMKKARPMTLNKDNIYSGLTAAYSGGNIGDISNAITKIWNSNTIGENELKAIKLLCMENNFTIDYAKTLYKPTRPEDISNLICKYTKCKVPHFFIYAKNKTSEQVEPISNSLIDSFSKRIKSPILRLNIKNFGTLNYRNLLNNKLIKIDDKIIEKYNELNKKYHFKINQKNKDNIDFIISQIKDELLELGSNDIEVTDMLVKYLYSNKKTPYKEVLWQCFGDIIVNNLKNNIPNNSIQCKNCGTRFVPKSNNQVNCEKCQKELRTIYYKENKRKQRKK